MVGSQLWWSKFRSDRSDPDERLAADLASILLDGIGTPENRRPVPIGAIVIPSLRPDESQESTLGGDSLELAHPDVE